MKKFIMIIAFIAIHSSAYFQQAAPPIVTSILDNISEIKGFTGNNFHVNSLDILNVYGLKFSTSKRVEGTAFFSNEWNWGFIKIDNGIVIDSVRLRYNTLYKELHFLDRESEYSLNDYFIEFGFTIMDKETKNKILFRNGFPAFDKNNTKTNYQILAGNEYKLLKLTIKELQENTALDGQTYNRITEKNSYYIYNSLDSTMVKVRMGVQQLLVDFPGLKEQIATICSKENLKCKSESDLITLFSNIITPTSALGEPETKKPF
ncbi:MAG TPA: hypothetical protein VI548_08480 [Chitinophagaceae bacterium]|nr:hypothetical protein [Chitinophagaceae bacterium]